MMQDKDLTDDVLDEIIAGAKTSMEQYLALSLKAERAANRQPNLQQNIPENIPTLRDGLAAIRSLGEIDSGKIQAERDSLNSPVIPDGWVMVPIEPTEHMIVEGFESEPDEFFSDAEVWETYDAMSGCQQAAHRAKLCWAAMIKAAPKQQCN
ncbi:hypothetical protein ACM7S2_10345, partial [Enterobacter hormaechei]